MTERQLPEPFHDLEPYLGWSLPTARERRAKREASPMREITTFYEALLPRMEEILSHLDRFSPEDAPGDVQRLLLLTLSLAEVAPAVEWYGSPRIEGLDVSRFQYVDLYPTSEGRAEP